MAVVIDRQPTSIDNYGALAHATRRMKPAEKARYIWQNSRMHGRHMRDGSVFYPSLTGGEGHSVRIRKTSAGVTITCTCKGSRYAACWARCLHEIEMNFYGGGR